MKKSFQLLKILTFLLVSIIHNSLTVYAGDYSQRYQAKTYEEAQNAESYVYFDLISTKAGMFSSTVRGYVLDFNTAAFTNENTIKNAEVSFKVTDLNTDNNMRDNKLYNETLDTAISQNILIQLTAPINLHQAEEQSIEANIFIRNRSTPILVKIKLEEKGNKYVVKGNSELSIIKLELPDPSIFIATVDDTVKTGFRFVINKANIK